MNDNQVNNSGILTPDEKEYSINLILDKYENHYFKKSLLTPFKELPVLVILNTSMLVKVLSVLTFVIYFSIMSNIKDCFSIYDSNIFTYVLIMFFSPILYFINLIDITRSFNYNVYELESTFKYKFHQIIGYKFISITFISLLINFIAILVFPFLNFIDASITVLSSLFISTSFIYYVVFRYRNPLIPILLIILWSFINISCVVIFHYYNLYNMYANFKTMIYILGVVIALILHIVQFKYIYKQKYESRRSYVRVN